MCQNKKRKKTIKKKDEQILQSLHQLHVFTRNVMEKIKRMWLATGALVSAKTMKITEDEEWIVMQKTGDVEHKILNDVIHAKINDKEREEKI